MTQVRRPDDAARVATCLHEIAHGRAGDKGNRLNVSVIAYHPDAWPLIREQVTEAAVAGLFAARGVTAVRRYTLENMQALNFVLDDVLEGGVNSGLNLDAHGKSNAFRLLGMKVTAPLAVIERCCAARMQTSDLETQQEETA